MTDHSLDRTEKGSPWLILARWAIIGLAVFLLAISVIGVVLFPDYAVRHIDEFKPGDIWTAEQMRAAEAQLGWQPMTYAWLLLARDVIWIILNYLFAAMILWRKSRDWLGLYIAFVFIIIAFGTGNVINPIAETNTAVKFLTAVLGAISWQFFFILFFFFPNGQPVPRWTFWFAIAWVITMPFTVFRDPVRTPIFGALAFGFVATAIFSQIYRYFRRSDPIQRQQTKWLVYVLAIGLVTILLLPTDTQPPSVENLGRELLIQYASLMVFTLIFWLVPLVITIAIFRYRLWGIDFLIRRTLIYGLLTLILGMVYFVSVLIIQTVFRSLTGQESPAAVVFSTLACAALIHPLRRRIQSIIDRRFYRSQYNAEQTLLTFSASIRQNLDLEQTTTNLIHTVQETFQPEKVTFWIRSNPSTKYGEDRRK